MSLLLLLVVTAASCARPRVLYDEVYLQEFQELQPPRPFPLSRVEPYLGRPAKTNKLRHETDPFPKQSQVKEKHAPRLRTNVRPSQEVDQREYGVKINKNHDSTHSSFQDPPRRNHETPVRHNEPNETPLVNKFNPADDGDEQESTWVWGTSDTGEAGEAKNTTAVDDLDDRTSIAGANCPTGQIMCLLTLVLCVGVASSASVYRSGGGLEQDYEYRGGTHSNNENRPPLGLPPPPGHRRHIRLLDDRPVRENYDYGGGGYYREERQSFDRRPGPGDGPTLGLSPTGARPSGERYGEAAGFGPGRPPVGPPANPPRTERRGFGDRSNEITDENIDRIRTNIYSNVPTDRQPLYANTYKHEQNNFNDRRSGSDNEYRGAGGAGAGAGVDRRNPEVDANQSRDDSRRGTSDSNTRREPNTFGSRGAHNEAAGISRPAEPGVSRSTTRGQGAGEDSTWVWSSSVETTTTASTTPMDLDNRASFSGDNCPTGQIRIEGKCVETH